MMFVGEEHQPRLNIIWKRIEIFYSPIAYAIIVPIVSFAKTSANFWKSERCSMNFFISSSVTGLYELESGSPILLLKLSIESVKAANFVFAAANKESDFESVFKNLL